MNHNEYLDLPQPVRERYNEIPEGLFADHKGVVEIEEKIKANDAAHNLRVQRVVEAKDLVSGLNAQREVALAEVIDLEASRTDVLVNAFAEGGDFAEDDQILMSIGEKKRLIERIETAMPGLNERVKQAQRDVQPTASVDENLRAKRKDLLDSLRLALAEKRAGA